LAGSKSGDEMPTDSALADSNFANSKYPVQPQVRTAPTPECPSDDALRQLAAGLTPDSLAAQFTQHAATCDHCGPLLRTFTEDFSDDFTPEEQAALANLQSSSADWQQQTALKMLKASGVQAAIAPATDAQPAPQKSFAKPTAERKPFFWKWVLVPAIAAVVAVAAFSIWYTQRDTPERAQKLLAQASTDRRTLEMRFPGAAHSNYKQTLSGDSESLLNSPESLRQAANLIDSQLKKNPDEPHWLLLSARLNLLDWRYKPALAILDKIEDAKVISSPEMRMTRALALYEQAQWELERKDQSYGEIINLMGKTLQETPNDPTALFNRALACEKIHAYECAAADFRHLVEHEAGTGWGAEASDHLKEIEEKKTSDH
jgi:tetratricopeptide (TPR) repeat protein